MDNITELTAADLCTWDDVMRDDSPVPPLPLSFWFWLGRYEQPRGQVAA